MVRHLVRFAPKERILLLGAYPDLDLDPAHPLSDLLGVVAREAGYEHLHLKGLAPVEVTQLLAALAGHEVEENVGAAWVRQTEGNPFFIHELARHLFEEGSLYQAPDGRWTTTKPLRELGVPHRVREVVTRRLARLSKAANQLLQAAAAFDSAFRFDVVEGMAGLSELDALDALDETLAAHIVAPAGPAETYAFLRTLIRQTVYSELSPSRQVRLHRRAADALQATATAHLSPAEAGEIAFQYHRSASLPGAERGVEPALAAAHHAQTGGGYDEAAGFLRMALDMLPEADDRRPRLLGRLGIVLAWALAFDAAVEVAAEAGDAIAEAEGKAAATEYLSDAAWVCAMAGGVVRAWDLARRGLIYAGSHDVAWARFVSFDYERRAAEDPEHPGIPIDSAERRESARILLAAHLDPVGPAPAEAVFDSREGALQSSNLVVLTYYAGEYSRCLPLFEAEAHEAESLGRVARAARCWANVSACRAALGRLDEARQGLGKARALAARLGAPIFPVVYGQDFLTLALDEGWEDLAATIDPLTSLRHPALAWALGDIHAIAARAAAGRGRAEEAMDFLGRLVPWLERAPAWTAVLSLAACHAADALWVLGRLDHIEVVEGALREKVVTPDFRSPMTDGRLALARLCALSGRHDEAFHWFGEARRVLEEQGARPLLAITDHDEGFMYARRNEPGDTERARPLLEAANRQFEAIGMTGWSRRAEELSKRLG
jgi:tetratricopeptide (TPR) repeat protein